jgi:hypothetical protein
LHEYGCPEVINKSHHNVTNMNSFIQWEKNVHFLVTPTGTVACVSFLCILIFMIRAMQFAIFVPCHNYATRYSIHLRVPPCRTEIRRRSVRISAASVTVYCNVVGTVNFNSKISTFKNSVGSSL